MSICVFLGPTLSVDEARSVLDATYLPPASMGDVARLVERRPRAIAIIDGFFEHTPAVWHKEILFALSRGVRVLGSSSMGALRAAELDGLGMEGVGRVYEAFRSGRLEDDDEVAVVHGPADSGYRPLSVAMVNIRETLRRAADVGLISSTTHDLLVQAAKEQFYADRSWETLLHAAANLGLSAGEVAGLRAAVASGTADVKRDDALELLRRLAALDATDESRAAPARTGHFEPTFHWWRMLDHERRLAGADDIGEAALAHHVRLFAPRRGVILRHALVLTLASSEANRGGCELEDRDGALQPRPRGPDGARESLGAIPPDPFTALGLDVRPLLASCTVQVDRCLPDVLRRLGLLEEVSEAVVGKWRLLQGQGLAQPSLKDAGVALEQLLEWYAKRYASDAGEAGSVELEERWEELGFSSWEEALREVVAQYIYEKLQRELQPHAPVSRRSEPLEIAGAHGPTSHAR